MQKILHIQDGGYIKKRKVDPEGDMRELTAELTDLIFNKYESILLEKIVAKQYDYLEKYEQMFLMEECRQNLRQKREFLRRIVLERMGEYIETEDSINLEGFIRFRLPEYMAEIENTLDFAVNELIIDREYDQLIDGLILYIELQVPLIDTVNVFYDREKYIVSDNKGQEIFTLVHYDDVLLDVILTLAPRSIVIINPDTFANRELLNTIKKVFGNRICLINTTKPFSTVQSTSNLDKE